MAIYTLFEALVGLVGGILLAVCTKKSENVTYGKLDKAGRIINIVLIPAYASLAPVYLLLGMLSEPSYDGFLGVIGCIFGIITASAALFCGLGLGLSVALRKKGKSVPSFVIQFAGAAAIMITIFLYAIFAGNLFVSLN